MWHLFHAEVFFLLFFLGLESDDEEEEEEDQNEGKKGNPFEDLNGRFEEEKEALLARLRGE